MTYRYPESAMIDFIAIAMASQHMAMVMIWAFWCQGDTKSMSLIQQAMELNKPSAEILTFERRA